MQDVNPKQTSSRRNNHICYFILAMTSLVNAYLVWLYAGDQPCIVPLVLNSDGSKPNCNGEGEEQEIEPPIDEAGKEQDQRNLSVDHYDPTRIVNSTLPIINGQDAGWNEYPWFVILGGCSGSLIAPEV